MSGYVIDSDGDRWPMTGWWCQACDMPLTPVRPGQETHPWCAFRAELDRATTTEVITELTRQLGTRPTDPGDTDQ